MCRRTGRCCVLWWLLVATTRAAGRPVHIYLHLVTRDICIVTSWNINLQIFKESTIHTLPQIPTLHTTKSTFLWSQVHRLHIYLLSSIKGLRKAPTPPR